MPDQLVDVIHMGYPRTGTTFLQAELVPRLEGVISLGRGPALLHPDYKAMANRLAGDEPFGFSPDAFRAGYAELHRRHGVGPTRQGVRFLSHEHLCGDLYGGWRVYQLIDRVRDVFGPVKVLLTIRAQPTMLESVYRHYVYCGGPLHIRELLYKRTSPGVDVWGNRQLLERFLYDRVVARCQEVFGRDRVCVVPLEYLRDEPDRLVREVCDFLDVEAPTGVDWPALRRNEGLSYMGTNLLRGINQIVSTPLSDSPLLRLVPQMHSRFVSRVYRPLDRVVLGSLSRRRSFVDKPKTWWWRGVAKRLLVALRWLGGRGARPLRPGFLNDVARYLEWPETERLAQGGRLGWDRSLDRRRIGRDLQLYYAESNRRTAQLTGLDLAALGYSVGAEGSGDDGPGPRPDGAAPCS